MSEDPALLQNQFDYADLAAKVAYQQALIRGQTEDEALKAAVAAADNSQKALDMATKLQGPRNAFQQQAMEVGLNGLGYSRAFDALAGKYSLPTFGQQFAPAQPMSLSTVAGDVAANPPTSTQDPITQVMNQLFAQLGWGSTPANNTGSAGGYGNVGASSGGGGSNSGSNVTNNVVSTGGSSTPTSTSQPSSQYGNYSAQLNAPTAGGTYMPSTAERTNQLAALPAPNKIDVRQWNQMSPDTQQFLLGAYSTAGQSPTDVQNTIQQIAPQFRAPKFGSITGG